MKSKIILILIFFLLILSAKAFSQTSVESEVDKAYITEGQKFNYKIVIVTTEKEIPSPILPEFKGLEVISHVQTSTISFAKNQLKRTIIYKFVLLPKQSGEIIIPPAKAVVNKQMFIGNSVKIEVVGP